MTQLKNRAQGGINIEQDLDKEKQHTSLKNELKYLSAENTKINANFINLAKNLESQKNDFEERINEIVNGMEEK